MQQNPATGLFLSGGGARGAYQIGVLRGLLAVTKRLGVEKPFQILSGVSAGAVNTAYLAARAADMTAGAEQLATFWSELHCDHVYRTDPWSLGEIGMHWAIDALSGGGRLGRKSRALLDTAPLRQLLRQRIPFTAIQSNLAARHIDAVCVAATNYATTECVSFYMNSGASAVAPWRRSRRVGQPRDITDAEIMASAAIPLLFPPVQVGDSHFGDGCLRNSAPLSGTIHLGAQRLIVIGVRKAAGIVPSPETVEETTVQTAVEEMAGDSPPSVARILNVVINAVLLDAIDADIERLARINRTVSLLCSKGDTTLKHIDWLYFHPSVDLAQIAIEEAKSLPRLIRYLVAGLGSLQEASDLVSYLLFEPGFCTRLLELGYQDALAKESDIQRFFGEAPVET
jgi:NTE family protein